MGARGSCSMAPLDTGGKVAGMEVAPWPTLPEDLLADNNRERIDPAMEWHSELDKRWKIVHF